MGKRIFIIGLSGVMILIALSQQAQAGRVPSIIGAIAGVSVLTAAYTHSLQPDADSGFIDVSVGGFDPIAADNQAVQFRLEYRAPFQIWRAKPIVGMFATTDGGVSAYFGVSHDHHLSEHIVLNVNTAGAFYASGNGKHLGSYAVLRSGVELGYRFDNRARVALTLHHMSHGKIFDQKNPGTESVALTFMLPM